MEIGAIVSYFDAIMPHSGALTPHFGAITQFWCKNLESITKD